MIVKEKILLEFNIPTISGAIYPDELIPAIMTNIIYKDVVGIIQNKPFDEDEITNPVCRVCNPQCLVDEEEDGSHLILVCDVVIDETKISKEELEMLNTKPWRLNAIGKGNIDENTKIVSNYDLVYVNIEMVEDSDYNN